MRLLNTKSLEFGEFFDIEIPKYAILSHRWGENEVLYKEFRKGKASEGPGLNKIRESCALAAKHGLEWIWIDTCCIDKRSSAELSEAINSMYKWYKQSAVCYVYLADVCYSPSDVSILRDIQDRSLNHPQVIYDYGDGPPAFSTFHEWNALKQEFRNSSWFSRGWTLQELLAPRDINFFDKRWTFIGDRQQLKDDISEITDIAIDYLSYFYHRFASIAQKMSWASRRKTSRGEDLAYCLLGLFDINMPLLYGEGAEKAFYRLQAEILKSSTDETIFAWTSPFPQFQGLLAAHPRCFADSGDIIPNTDHTNIRPPYTITNRGLQMSIPSGDVLLDGTLTIRLRCHYDLMEKDLVLHLFMHQGAYVRIFCETLQCARQQPHPLSSAEDNSYNSCTIYMECFRPQTNYIDHVHWTLNKHQACRIEQLSRKQAYMTDGSQPYTRFF